MKILLASSDKFFSRVARAMLTREHQLVLAESAAEAIARAQTNEMDAMALDLELKGLHQGDATEQLNEILAEKGTPLLMIINLVEPIKEADWEDLGVGADEILFKHSDPAKLISKLLRLVQSETQEKSRWSEKRKHPRLPVDMDVTTLFPDGVSYSSAANISTGGLYLELEHPVGKQTQVALRFLVPGGSGLLTVDGLVAWSKEIEPGKRWGMGIRFVQMDENTMGQIRSYAKALHRLASMEDE